MSSGIMVLYPDSELSTDDRLAVLLDYLLEIVLSAVFQLISYLL